MAQASVPSRQSYNPIVRTFNQFRTALLASGSLERQDIRPGTPLEHVLPEESRRELWGRLVEQGFSLPPLGLPSREFLKNMSWVVRVTLSIAIAVERSW